MQALYINIQLLEIFAIMCYCILLCTHYKPKIVKWNAARTYRKSEKNFVVIVYYSQWQLWKIILQRHMHAINVNEVTGSFLQIFSTWKLVIQKFHNTKISRSTVHEEEHMHAIQILSPIGPTWLWGLHI